MTEQPENTQQEKEALLPDGIGLNLEQAKALITHHCGIKLGNDDPALMGITICNAYLGEIQKLHNRHKEGLALLMAEKTTAYITGVSPQKGNRAGFLQEKKTQKSHAAQGCGRAAGRC